MSKKQATLDHNYTEDSIQSLDWKEHIRLRPGMYIGKLGDGSSRDDGIYVLLKEVIDNCIDEYVMGYGKSIEIEVREGRVRVRDYGRGIPLGKVVECVSKINTGGKYDSQAFQKSVGLNGVGTKAVNALSSSFRVQSVRQGKTTWAEFQRGELSSTKNELPTNLSDGTEVIFYPDDTIFQDYEFRMDYIETMVRNYTYLNVGLKLVLNGQEFSSQNGLLDLLQANISDEALYPVIHLKGKDIEVAFTHTTAYGEDYYSFVNGQHTTQGGTHLAAFREAIVKTAREFYGKDFDPSDVRTSIMAAVSVRIQEPVFESQTKTKLGSQNVYPGGPSLRNWINEFVSQQLDNYLHKHPETAEAWKKKILQSERERKDIAGIKKLANERAKTANLHNKQLRDCRVNMADHKNPQRLDTTLFIT
ncbi:MAG: ATP-binding protein, partial [Bacteroidota bacterium]